MLSAKPLSLGQIATTAVARNQRVEGVDVRMASFFTFMKPAPELQRASKVS